jgi:cytoskeletal protein CcmA (bactofilin family)
MITIFNRDKDLQKYQIIKPKLNKNNDWITSDPIILDMPIEGNIYCYDKVIINAEGQLRGNIYSKSCEINGNVIGNVYSSDLIEVKNRAIIDGNLIATRLVIEDGSLINGFINIEKELNLPAFPVNMEDSFIDTSNIVHEISDEVLPKSVLALHARRPSKNEIKLTEPTNNQKTNILPETSSSSITSKFKSIEDSGRWW